MKIMLLAPSSRFSRNVVRDLVYGCWCKGRRIAGTRFPPLPLVLIATILKFNAFEVIVVDADAMGLGRRRLDEKVLGCDIVIVLTSSVSFNEDAQLLLELKQVNPKLKTIVFGGYVTAFPEVGLQHSGIDIVVRHEPEYILRDLLRAWREEGNSWKKTRGISFKEDATFVHNPDYPLIENLDDLPIPDRSFLPRGVNYFNPLAKNTPYTTMITSRGCTGKCIFCSSPNFYGNKIRYRHADKVLEELKLLRDCGYKEVFFRDEVFTFSKERVKSICKMILQEKVRIGWICSTRVDSLDFQILKIMQEAGCHMVRLGVETGVQGLLDNIKKGITVEQTKEVFHWLRQLKMDSHAHIMVGIPGENKNTLSATMKFIKEIDPTIATFGIFTPYPGTPIFKDLKNIFPEMGDGSTCNLSNLHTRSFYNEYFTDLSPKEISSALRKCYADFYLRPGYIIKWLRKIKSPGELKRVTLAALQVCEFIIGRD